MKPMNFEQNSLKRRERHETIREWKKMILFFKSISLVCDIICYMLYVCIYITTF